MPYWTETGVDGITRQLVGTNELAVGDVVETGFGGVVYLTRGWTFNDWIETGYGFRSWVMNEDELHQDPNPVVPESWWRNGAWTIQGNHLARWTRRITNGTVWTMERRGTPRSTTWTPLCSMSDADRRGWLAAASPDQINLIRFVVTDGAERLLTQV